MPNPTDSILDGRLTRRKSRKQSRKFSFRFYQVLYGPIVFIKAAYRQLLVLTVMIIIGAAIFAN